MLERTRREMSQTYPEQNVYTLQKGYHTSDAHAHKGRKGQKTGKSCSSARRECNRFLFYCSIQASTAISLAVFSFLLFSSLSF